MEDTAMVKEMLTELNHLEQVYGRVLHQRDPDYDPSGEARARIELLINALEEMGVHLKWDGWQYQVIASNEEGDPDARPKD